MANSVSGGKTVRFRSSKGVTEQKVDKHNYILNKGDLWIAIRVLQVKEPEGGIDVEFLQGEFTKAVFEDFMAYVINKIAGRYNKQ